MADNRLLRVVVLGGMGLIGAAAAGMMFACETREPMREGPPPPPREGPPPPTYTVPVPALTDAGAPLLVVVPDASPTAEPPPSRRPMFREGPPPRNSGF